MQTHLTEEQGLREKAEATEASELFRGTAAAQSTKPTMMSWATESSGQAWWNNQAFRRPLEAGEETKGKLWGHGKGKGHPELHLRLPAEGSQETLHTTDNVPNCPRRQHMLS